MKLRRLEYSDYLGEEREWTLDPLTLGDVNLLVGRNASGKSRTLSVINSLSRMISRRVTNLYDDSNYVVYFEDGDTKYKYTLSIRGKRVIFEQYIRGKKKLLDRREGGYGKIYATKDKRLIDFQTPDTQLAIVSRQDAIQHAYLEKLQNWAEGVLFYRLGSDLGRTQLALPIKADRTVIDFSSTGNLIPFWIEGDNAYGADFKADIIADMTALDYPIEDIGLRTPPGIEVGRGVQPTDVQNIYVTETGLQTPTDQIHMSQGMFRVLSIVVQINLVLRARSSGLFLIDDIGEGLDFERAAALIDLCINKSKALGGQLIMATNDRFIMNRVPLEAWTLLRRDGNRVSIFNYANAKEIFEEFKYSGLSNFDFFASDYVGNRLN